MTCVVIESPLGGDYLLVNYRYAQACMLDSLSRGEAPYLSHLLYPQVIDDHDAEGRRVGMAAGEKVSRLLLDASALHVYYLDLGMSRGMKAAQEWNYAITVRLLGGIWDEVARRIAAGRSVDSILEYIVFSC